MYALVVIGFENVVSLLLSLQCRLYRLMVEIGHRHKLNLMLEGLGMGLLKRRKN